MSSDWNKFIFTTTYRQDYSSGYQAKQVSPRVDQGQVECRDFSETPRQRRKSAAKCPCTPGGSMAKRAKKLDVKCGCPSPNEKLTLEEMAKIMYEAAEAGAFKTDAEKNATCTSCLKEPDLNPLRGKPTKSPEPESYGRIRPMAPGKFGGAFEGTMNLPNPSDQGSPYVFSTPCKCEPPAPSGGPQNYGPAWIRENARDKPAPEIRKETDKTPETSPSPIVKCSELGAMKNDQPNTFMKKLYQKYPYLYQILRDTPPEELIARVFKDRFLSTYQVDYLHMGSGKEHYPAGGSLMNEKYTGPDGSPEPDMIPGCFYRSNQKEYFGKKKNDLKTVREKLDGNLEEEVVKPEPVASEYMRSISKLGGDIISDQLYKIEAATKRMMKTYINF